ncbi:MAG: hypothetical protein LC104_04150 [Bacteroidales bacterium]|nr:hypothetical protein [Bacteroidales bacterium]
MSRFLAITVDHHRLFVVAGTARSHSVKIEKTLAWMEDVPPLTPATAATLGAQLKERLQAAGISPAPILLGIGRERVILKELRYPPVPPAEEPNIVRFQALKEVTEAAGEVVFDFVPHTTQATATERRSTAVVVSRDLVQAAQELAATLGVKLLGITPVAFVAGFLVDRARQAGILPTETTNAVPGTVGLLMLDAHGGEFILVHNHDVLLARSIAAPVVASEKALIAEIKRNLAVFAVQHPRSPVSALLLTAGWDRGYSDALAEALSVPVFDYDPLTSGETGLPSTLHGALAGPLGLLAARADSATLPINFVEPRQPKPEKDPFQRQLLFAAIVAFLLLFTGIGFGWMEVSAASRKLQSLQIAKLDLEAEKAQLESEAKRVRFVEDWEQRSPIWLDELYDLADRFERLETTRILSMTAATLQPDKAGKRPASGRLEIKLGTRDPEAVSDLVTAINRDNTTKDKHYVSVQKTTGGLASGNTPFNQLFTITILVNRREPEKYTRKLEVPLIPPSSVKHTPDDRP